MSKKIFLSNTSIDTYKLCSQKYKLHYIDKLRDTSVGSALFFGSALDSAVEILLLSKKDNLTEFEKQKLKLDPKEQFIKRLTYIPVNNDIVNIKKYENVQYYKSDFDSIFITKEEQLLLKKDGYEIDQDKAKIFIDECYDIIKSNNKLTKEEQQLFNLLHWYSIRKKGLLLLEAYEKQIIPKINKVYEIQKAVKLEDEEGNILRGFIDFVADWDKDGKVVFDNKTSSKKYTKDSVKQSQQLIIYGEDQEHYKAGFIVMLKSIKMLNTKKCTICNNETSRRIKQCDEKVNNKKCNGDFVDNFNYNTEIQVIIDDLEHELQEKVFKEIGQVLQDIKKEKFDKNFDSCYSFFRKCPYYDLCRNGSKEGLVDMKKEE